MIRSASTSSRRTTYKVRPLTRMCVGPSRPSAAATNDGAAIAASDSTAQSANSVRTRWPKLMLNCRSTRPQIRVDVLRQQRRVDIAGVLGPSSASARANPSFACWNAPLSGAAASMTLTRLSWAILGP